MVQVRSDAKERKRAVSCRIAVLLISALLAGTGLPAAAGLANPQSVVVLPESGPWTSRDYMHVLFAVLNGQITLPRRDNPKTAALFAKLIDRSNIDQLMASSLAATRKRQQILIIFGTTGELRSRYGYSVSLGDEVENELIEIQAFRLYLIGRLARLDAEDGLTACPAGERCDNAIVTALSGTLDTLADSRLFTNDQRAALTNAFAEHYPAIRMKLITAEHLEITTRLEAMTAAESDPVLKSSLAAVLAEAKRGN